ncbi:hypothetical protein FB451DRAFT_1083131 [Mycena latifolia]|nr:hypothetical protein FB451DRAFT_1083131 [Mycena latifolia]
MSSESSQNSARTAMPTYQRPLSPNELSYFLPSRAYGLNDMFIRITIRAAPTLVSPLRLRAAWAIMRLRHTLLACKIEMDPGRYDEARFAYTPPASPRKAVEEAGDALGIYDDKTGLELVHAFTDLAMPRKLSAARLAHMDVARHGPVANGIEEFEILILTLHAINDGISAHRLADTLLELLGGGEPGGAPRTDAELARLLEMEWTARWDCSRVDANAVIVPATEGHFLQPRSKLQNAAWAVDHANVQRRAVGGHTIPRIKSPKTKYELSYVVFSAHETASTVAACKTQRVTLASAMFALCSLAWIRTASDASRAAKTLPLMMYTAVSLRRHFSAPPPPFDSWMSLALGYATVVLPAFIPPDADPRALFWLRARRAQAQLHQYGRSPLLPGRSQVVAAARAARAKAFARLDDTADGMPPPSTPAPKPAEASPGVPSVALMGLSCVGELNGIYHPARYPAIEHVRSMGHVRLSPGGILFFMEVLDGRMSMTLGWDAAAFAPGLIEAFWGRFVGGVREFMLDEAPLKRREARL